MKKGFHVREAPSSSLFFFSLRDLGTVLTVKACDEEMNVDPAADTAKTPAAAGANMEVPHTCMLASDILAVYGGGA